LTTDVHLTLQHSTKKDFPSSPHHIHGQ